MRNIYSKSVIFSTRNHLLNGDTDEIAADCSVVMMEEGSGLVTSDTDPAFLTPGSVNDLLNIQNGGAGVVGGQAAADSDQLISQGDLEALASIQEELDRMGSASASQTSFVEGEISVLKIINQHFYFQA